MTRPGRLLAVLGVKGGSGCSLVGSLMGRILAKSMAGRTAVVDGIPCEYSSAPSFLGLKSTSHDFLQLEPYREHLSENLVEGFFSRSPEGACYVPLATNDQRPFPMENLPEALQTLRGFFDRLILDLSSFPQDRALPLLESCERIWVVSSTDPACLVGIRPLEKRLLTRQISLGRATLLFNQVQRGQSPPSNPSGWSEHLPFGGSIPHCGESLSLLEGGPIPLVAEKALAPLLPDQEEEPSPVPAAPSGVTQEATLETVHRLHQDLLERLRRSGKLTDGSKGILVNRRDLEAPAREILEGLLEERKVEGRPLRQALTAETMDLAFGFGPLEPLLRDPAVSEIMVNGRSDVFVEKSGRLERTGRRFFDETQLRTVIERILAPLGRRIDESQPYVDGRLPDGSRINAIIPPLSLEGPVLTIRKFPGRRLGIGDLVRSGALTQEAADFLGACVRCRKNIVVSGGTGSGKTTLLNVLSGFIPAGERIITIEDSAELKLDQEHVVRLESRPANLEGQGRVAIRDLVVNSLRMRPDRIVVGEVRGGEALDMLQAMNTGHDGSLTTVHANSPRDALSRLETLCLFSGLELPLRAVREQIVRAVHLVIQQSRLPDGKRGVVKISETQGMEGDVVVLQDLFERSEGGVLRQGPFAPSFARDLQAAGYRWPARP